MRDVRADPPIALIASFRVIHGPDLKNAITVRRIFLYRGNTDGTVAEARDIVVLSTCRCTIYILHSKMRTIDDETSLVRVPFQRRVAGLLLFSVSDARLGCATFRVGIRRDRSRNGTRLGSIRLKRKFTFVTCAQLCCRAKCWLFWQDRPAKRSVQQAEQSVHGACAGSPRSRDSYGRVSLPTEHPV